MCTSRLVNIQTVLGKRKRVKEKKKFFDAKNANESLKELVDNTLL